MKFVDNIFFKTTTGILSGPEVLLISRFTIIPETFLGVMKGSLMEIGVRRGKSGGERILS